MDEQKLIWWLGTGRGEGFVAAGVESVVPKWRAQQKDRDKKKNRAEIRAACPEETAFFTSSLRKDTEISEDRDCNAPLDSPDPNTSP